VRASAPDLKLLARALKQSGRKDLRKELYSGLNRGTKPARAAVRAAWLAELPQSGGLAARVARSSVTVRQRGPGVQIVARGSKRGVGDIESIERGVVRHPVYGNRGVWVKQAVPPRIFEDTCREVVDDNVMNELLDGIEAVAKKLAAG
jgi:hypothetical protein